MNKCATCIAWDITKGGKAIYSANHGHVELGGCKMMPPVAVPGNAHEAAYANTKWPVTRADEWCMQHQDKETYLKAKQASAMTQASAEDDQDLSAYLSDADQDDMVLPVIWVGLPSGGNMSVPLTEEIKALAETLCCLPENLTWWELHEAGLVGKEGADSTGPFSAAGKV